MLDTYAASAARSLWRRKSQTLLNVVGLAVALAACLLIGRYVADAWRFDAFHDHADRIVRVTAHLHGDATPMHLSTAQGPVAPVLAGDLPIVESYVRFVSGSYLLRHGDRSVRAASLPHVDSTFFDVFSFDLIEGDPASALAGPNQIVLTRDLAERVFGIERALGQSLQTESGLTLTVTGVLGDVPKTSHLQFEGLVSITTRQAFDPDRITSWHRFSYWTYLLLKDGASPEALEAAIPGVMGRHTSERMQRNVRYEVMPLTDIYLHSDSLYPIGPTGSATAFRVFLIVAVFILLVAISNFVNLSTARATERAREIGVRKTLGASRSTLIGQFLTEAVLTSVLAMIAAVGLARVSLPVFDAVAGTSLAGGLIPDASVLGILLLAGIGVGLLAGAYPALVLARYRPARVLRGTFSRSKEGLVLRKSLVIGQFAVAIALLACTGVVQQQLRYAQTRDLGFAADQLVTLRIGSDVEVGRRVEALKRELTALAGVESAAASSYVPGTPQNVFGFRVEGPDGQTERVRLNRNDVDPDFIETFGIEVVAGRGFSRAFPSDSTSAVIVNASAARRFGFRDPADAVGRRVHIEGRSPDPAIVGVVDDFHYSSLHETVEPIVFFPLGAPETDPYPDLLTLRVATDDLAATMEAVGDRWATLVPDQPLEATFVDRLFADMYAQDRRVGNLFGAFAGLAIFVACLGLFGLATQTVQQRTKEIGIRKALGATARGLVVLLSRDFAVLVAGGFVVGVPVAYLGMERWLSTFAYRIDPGVGVFLAAGAVALVVALAAVGGHAWRAATTAPTDALRSE